MAHTPHPSDPAAAGVALAVAARWPAGLPPPLLSSFSMDALEAAREAAPHLPRGLLQSGSDTALIPASPVAQMTAFQARLRQQHPWMDLGLARRWSRAYGSRVALMLDGVHSRADLGAEVAPDLYEAELFYLRRHEWALTADDVLWRRTKLGLRYSPAQRQAVADWLAAQG